MSCGSISIQQPTSKGVEGVYGSESESMASASAFVGVHNGHISAHADGALFVRYFLVSSALGG